MPVQINITGADAAESLRELSALSFGLCGNVQVAAVATPVKEDPKPRRTATKPESARPEKVVEEKPEGPKKDESQSDSDNASADDSEDIPDDAALRAAAMEKSSEVGKAAVKALLDKYEVKNVSALPKDQRIAFLHELTELSA